MRPTFLKATVALGLLSTAAYAVPVDADSASTNAASSAASTSQQNCKVVSFTVNGSAENRNLTAGIVLGTLDALRQAFDAAPLVNISGPQTLVGTYCLPTVRNSNNQKIQMLFGSIVADRNGWSAQGGVGTDYPQYKPEQYSWVRYANAQGYPTLALDRLGSGKSSHPDALLVAQAPYEEALYADLAKQVRAGSTSLGQAYQHLIYVGNSYGSQLGAGIAGAYPDAYDEYVLTGFSSNVQQDFVGVALVIPLPAQVVDPAKFGTLPVGYVTSSSEQGRTNSFFGSKQQVDFEDEVAHLFFLRKDVVSIGQYVSVYAATYNGAGFKGRVFTLTGEQDQAFCGPGSPVIGPAHCGPLLQQTGALFPDADYNWQSVDKTGHAIQLHNSSQKVYSIAHQFLSGQSFKGGPPA